jgi:hypothetical protein
MPQEEEVPAVFVKWVVSEIQSINRSGLSDWKKRQAQKAQTHTAA